MSEPGFVRRTVHCRPPSSYTHRAYISPRIASHAQQVTRLRAYSRADPVRRATHTIPGLPLHPDPAFKPFHTAAPSVLWPWVIRAREGQRPPGQKDHSCAEERRSSYTVSVTRKSLLKFPSMR